MDEPSILYDRLIDFRAVPDQDVFTRRVNVVHSFSCATQATDLVVDHFKRCAWLFHYNPEYVGTFGGMGRRLHTDDYFDRLVSPEDAGLFTQFVSAIKDCIRDDFLKGDRHYYFSFEIRLRMPGAEDRIYSLRVIPFIFTPDHTPWVTVYYIGSTEKKYPGNLVLHSLRQNAIFNFDVAENQFNPRAKICNLSDIEKNILQLAAEGITENKIAKKLGLSVSNLKNQKTRMFDRLSVNSISAAITIAYNQGLLD